MNEVTHADEGSRWKAVRRFASEHPIAVAVTLLCAVWAASAQPLSELAPSVQSLHHWTMVIGTLSWGWWLLMHCAPGVADQGRSLGSIVERAYVRLALLGFVLLAERSCGNELALVVQALRNSPDLVYIVGLSAAIVYAAFSFAPKMPGGMLAEARAVMTAQEPQRARERKDIHRTSVHEAGHVLMFALKKTLPDSLRVEVFSRLGRDDEYRGKVTFPNESCEAARELELVWSMLLSLSGTEAELLIFGERAEGTFGDNQAWMTAAHTYLSSGFGEPYYSKPGNATQYEHNLLVMTRLKDVCTARVAAFMAANKELLQELGLDIEEALVMEFEQLQPYLTRVVGTEGVLDVRVGR